MSTSSEFEYVIVAGDEDLKTCSAVCGINKLGEWSNYGKSKGQFQIINETTEYLNFKD